MNKKYAYLKYLFALLLFGSNGIAASMISLSSYEIVFLRTLIGSLLLISIFLCTKHSCTFWKYKRYSSFIICSGIAMGLSWMFLYEAYQQIGVSMASLAYYCGPVIVVALSPVIFHERLTRFRITGFAAVLLGIFLVNGQAFQRNHTNWGLFCGAMSAVMYAFMVIFNKKSEKIVGLENTVLQLTASFFTVAIFVGMKQGFLIQVPNSSWLPILILGLANTGIGCYFYFSSIGKLPIQTVAICGYLEPLSAVLFSVLFLRETLTIVQLIGAVLIFSGAILSEYRKIPRTV